MTHGAAGIEMDDAMRIVFMGSGEIALPTLLSLARSTRHELAGLVAQPDRPSGRHLAPRPPPTKLALAGYPAAVLQPERIRDPAAVAAVAALRPDAVVVMAYGQILPAALLAVPRLVCLNLHASLLPRHRGASPIQAAIREGDRTTGITVIHVAEGLDCGDIVLARVLEIGPRETAGQLHDRLALLAPAALDAALAQVERGTAPRIPQDESRATWAPRLERGAGRIEWAAPADAIERGIRAFNPWPGAFTHCPAPRARACVLKIHLAEVGPAPAHPAPPGTVLASRADRLLVACGEGTLCPLEVQVEGGRRLETASFLRGHPLAPGTLLG